jgi:hypothetical protein
MDRADSSERVLNSVLFSNEFYENLSNAVLVSLILGTSVLKYVVERRYGRTIVYPEHCDPGDVGFDPDAKDIQSAKYAYHDVYKPIYHLLQLEKDNVYHGVKRLMENDDVETTDVPKSFERLADIGLAPSQFRVENVKLTEWYINYKNPMTGDYKPLLITVANDKYIIRAEDNFFGMMPFERVALSPYPDEFYGISIPQIVEYLVYEGNEKRNQVLDANNLMINPMYQVIYNSIMGEDEYSDIVMEPGGIIEVGVENAIKPIQHNFQSLIAGAQDLAMTEKSIQDAIGVFDYNRGAPRAGDQTATEITSLINEGNMRFLMMIMNLENITLRRVGTNILKLMKNNMGVTESFKMMRPELDKDSGLMKVVKDFESIKSSDIEWELDIKCMASAAYNMRAIESANMMLLLQQITTDPEAQAFVDKYKLYKMVARSLNIKDLSFFKKPEEVQEQQLPNEMSPEEMMGLLGGGVGALGGQPAPPQGMVA